VPEIAGAVVFVGVSVTRTVVDTDDLETSPSGFSAVTKAITNFPAAASVSW